MTEMPAVVSEAAAKPILTPDLRQKVMLGELTDGVALGLLGERVAKAAANKARIQQIRDQRPQSPAEATAGEQPNTAAQQPEASYVDAVRQMRNADIRSLAEKTKGKTEPRTFLRGGVKLRSAVTDVTHQVAQEYRRLQGQVPQTEQQTPPRGDPQLADDQQKRELDEKFRQAVWANPQAATTQAAQPEPAETPPATAMPAQPVEAPITPEEAVRQRASEDWKAQDEYWERVRADSAGSLTQPNSETPPPPNVPRPTRAMAHIARQAARALSRMVPNEQYRQTVAGIDKKLDRYIPGTQVRTEEQINTGEAGPSPEELAEEIMKNDRSETTTPPQPAQSSLGGSSELSQREIDELYETATPTTPSSGMRENIEAARQLVTEGASTPAHVIEYALDIISTQKTLSSADRDYLLSEVDALAQANPADKEVMRLVAETYRASGNEEKAKEYDEKLLEETPTESAAAPGQREVPPAGERSKFTKDEVSELARVPETTPEPEGVFDNYERLLAEGDFLKAIIDLRLATRLRPDLLGNIERRVIEFIGDHPDNPLYLGFAHNLWADILVTHKGPDDQEAADTRALAQKFLKEEEDARKTPRGAGGPPAPEPASPPVSETLSPELQLELANAFVLIDKQRPVDEVATRFNELLDQGGKPVAERIRLQVEAMVKEWPRSLETLELQAAVYEKLGLNREAANVRNRIQDLDEDFDDQT